MQQQKTCPAYLGLLHRVHVGVWAEAQHNVIIDIHFEWVAGCDSHIDAKVPRPPASVQATVMHMHLPGVNEAYKHTGNAFPHVHTKAPRPPANAPQTYVDAYAHAKVPRPPVNVQ